MKYLPTPSTADLFLLSNCAAILAFTLAASNFSSLNWLWSVLSYGIIALATFTLGHDSPPLDSESACA
ncbi:hypothetical protein [Pedobacter immunditicola]|uniref:hypothetical protein n=1 Tax=Pedobacter immunditicola TaxID=3133440 RepID=UPI0030A62C91